MGKSTALILQGLFEQLFSIPNNSDHGDDYIIHVDDTTTNAMDASEGC